ncbi:MAG: hypothetical protein U0Q11_28090 [Vicinamibacterales bacterium]
MKFLTTTVLCLALPSLAAAGQNRTAPAAIDLDEVRSRDEVLRIADASRSSRSARSERLEQSSARRRRCEKVNAAV